MELNHPLPLTIIKATSPQTFNQEDKTISSSFTKHKRPIASFLLNNLCKSSEKSNKSRRSLLTDYTANNKQKHTLVNSPISSFELDELDEMEFDISSSFHSSKASYVSDYSSDSYVFSTNENKEKDDVPKKKCDDRICVKGQESQYDGCYLNSYEFLEFKKVTEKNNHED